MPAGQALHLKRTIKSIKSIKGKHHTSKIKIFDNFLIQPEAVFLKKAGGIL